jgi:hypothetical protein
MASRVLLGRGFPGYRVKQAWKTKTSFLSLIEMVNHIPAIIEKANRVGRYSETVFSFLCDDLTPFKFTAKNEATQEIVENNVLMITLDFSTFRPADKSVGIESIGWWPGSWSDGKGGAISGDVAPLKFLDAVSE